MEQSQILETLSASVRVIDCYQCGKCTAGCPVAAHMDAPPTKIIRLLQLGDWDSAIRARSIWQCVSCQTCSTRCPKSVDCAAAMDAVREAAFQRGAAPADCRAVVVFQRAFLDNIRRHGRLNEIDLIARFKGEVFFKGRSPAFLFRDAGLAAELHKRRKLHLRGETVRDRGVVERIFQRTAGGVK
jgi:heterodisulfide reductase subunit C2